MKKKLLIVLLAIVASLCLAFGIAGCSDNSSKSGSDSSNNTGQTPSDGETQNMPTEGLRYRSNGDGYTVTGIGTATDTDIVIPSEYNGLPVTKIGSSAFSNCSSLTSVTIPDSVTEIGDRAFYGCESLTSITIPDSVTEIGDRAFYNCTSLTSIIIPDGVTSIEYSTFFGCSSLVSVTIGSGVASIESEAFYGCTALTEIYYNATACEDLGSYNNYVFAYAGLDGDGITVTIGANVTSIPAYLFYVSNTSYSPNIVSVVLEEESQCTSIGTCAFADCTSLKGVYIKDINAWCNISFGDYYANPLYYADFYLNGKLLTDLVIPDEVTEINSYAFYNCTSLASITIPDGLTSIGTYAFYKCTALEGVYITDLTAWCNISFGDAYANPMYYASQLYLNGEVISGDIVLEDGITAIPWGTFKNSSIASITIPNSVISIGSSAFYNCTSLTSVTIGSGVTSIGGYVFYNCTALTEINYNATACEDLGGSGWITVGNFYNVGRDTDGITLTIGANVTRIPAYMFPISSANIVNIVFEKGSVCASIGEHAFYGCNLLEGVYIADLNAWCNISFGDEYANPMYYASQLYLNEEVISGDIVLDDSITKIPYGTFKNSSITSIAIPDSVTSIGERAFYNCISLTSIIVPDSVTSIGSAAFAGCSSLESITLPFVGGISSASSSSSTHLFGYIFGTSSYTGGTATKQYYISSSSYTTYYIPTTLTSVTITGGEILYGAFYNCSNLISITIPGSVTSIGNYAFYGCTSLENITIPDGVTSIGNYAFYGCTKLTSVYITDLNAWCNISFGNDYANPMYYASQLYLNGEVISGDIVLEDGITAIPWGTFKNSSIASITIPNSVISIGSSAFYNCTSLTSVTIGDSVTSIGDRAFEDCTALEGVYITDITAWLNISFSNYYANPLYYAGNLYLNGELVTELVIPDEVTTINSYAFRNCTSLTSVTIGESVTSIGEYAFYGCSSLISVTIGESVTSIGEYAFYGCSSLISVTIGESVTSIGSYAFSGCTSLTEINYNATDCEDLSSNGVFANAGQDGEGIIVYIGANVTSIPAYLFYCNGINWPYIFSVVFEEGSVCTSIGKYAFAYCTSLTSVTIPVGVTSIDEYAFYNCTSLTDVYITDLTAWCNISFGNDYANPMYYASHIYLNDEVISGDIVLEDGITEIPYGTFKNSSITSITLPDGVTSIGNYAFYDCSSLTSIIIHDSVTSIGNYAFYNCSLLESITLGNSVTSIGSYVFYGCSSLKSVTIGSCVASIGNYAFCNCISLEGVYITDITAWLNISFSNVWGNPLYYAGNLYLNGELVTELVIPNEVTTINSSAFYNCSSLTSINIPDSVTSIGSSAFSGCTSLTSITMGNSVTSIGGFAFYNCSSLESVTIGSSVTSIGNYAFYNCTSLTAINYNATACEDLSSSNYVFSNAGKNGDGITVTIGANVTKIPAYLFYPYSSSSYSPNIVSVVFEENSVCTSISNYAFYRCTALEGVYITDITAWLNISFSSADANPLYYAGNLYLNGELVTELVIPDEVTTINSYAFYGCTSLVSVTIYDGVTSIGSYAFYKCTSLTSIIIPDSVTSIGDYAFYNCSSFEGVYITDITAWLNISFGNASANPLYCAGNLYLNNELVTELVIPDEVIVINNYAFYGCTSLESVFIPDSVTEIGAYAFYGCSNLESVIIGSGVETIGNYAFYGCSKLTSIEIPTSVTSIGEYAFYNCYNLIEVYNLSSLDITVGSSNNGYVAYYAKNVYSTEEDSNLSITADGFIVYADDVAEEYYLVGYTGDLTDIILPESINGHNYGIYQYAFYNNTSLISVTIGSGVTSIGDRAFYGCTSLSEIYYNATACNDLSSNNYVFYNAGKNSEGITVTIGANVTKIPAYLFSSSYAPNIVSVMFEEGSQCTSIGDYAFGYCSSLTSITIPDSVTSIGSYAFEWCTSLESVTIGEGVTSIGNCAFWYCTSLENINIPDSVTTIGSYAFEYCISLTSITIGNGVTSIGSYAFLGCTALTEIYYNATACNDLSSNNYVFYNAGKNSEGITVTIGANVTKIPAYLFYPYSSSSYSPNIVNVVFEEGSQCTSIGSYAFYNCTALTSIIIPDSVTSIGSYAFYGCTSLTAINYNAAACEDLSSSNYVFYNTGKNGDGITVTIGANVTSIPAYLFGFSSANIVSVMFEEGSQCSGIGNYAFASLTSLASITIPDSVTSIGTRAFYNCTALTEIYYNATACEDLSNNNYVFAYAGQNSDGITVTIGANVTKIPAYLFYPYSSSSYSPNIVSVVFEESSVCTSIGSYAFYNCTALTSIIIPDSVTSIGSYAFYNCTSLTAINYNATACEDLSSSNYVFYNAGKNGDGITVTIGANVTKIPAYLFYPYSNSLNIVSVIFEDDSQCTSIGNYAFAYLTSIESITIPDSVISIGSYAFRGCTSLAIITIPDSVTSIGDYAFYGCTSLAIITIPDSVTSIGDYAFYGCTSLTNITIGNGVTSIGSYAFYNCTSLTEIYYNSTACGDLSSSNYVFYNAGKNGDGITVTIGANVTSIPAYLFYPYSSSSYSPNIVNVVFEEGSQCTSIGSYAFYNCTALTSITIPDSVTSIGYRAFYNCSKLTGVIFENTEGWWYANSSTATSGTSISSSNLSDTSTAAKYLTNTYSSYYWKRS